MRTSLLHPLRAAIAVLPLAILSAAAKGDAPEAIDFNGQVRPIFNNHCIACHGGVKQASELSFLRRSSVLAPAESGEIPIKPGDAEHSELMRRVTADEDERMPPSDHGKPLTAAEIDILRRWIDQGAQWDEHWAYVAPVKQDPPAVKRDDWCIKPLDHFILSRLEQEGLQPSPPADRRALLRRVTFDLIGLPPTPQELNDFLHDESPQAYEKVVDRLLSSPAYGERWTSMWLDLARYADTMGFEKDPHRNIWPYKDWLIRAFNADMPYDQFTIKQLAGDLLDDPSIDDLVATAFHRNTQTNTEGGTDDEEFRVQALIDRVNTTWQVWEGTTFGCTQCHSHPYAPFDHDEYYKFLAILNNTRDCDVAEEYPLLAVPLKDDDRPQAHELDGRISQLRQSLFKQFQAVGDEVKWTHLALDQATMANQNTAHLRIAKADDGVAEVLAEGTIANNPVYTLEAPAPAGVDRLTALQIEVLPTDPEAAQRTPEAGFVLSQLQGFVLTPGEKEPRKIDFQVVYSDEAEPTLDPAESLKEGGFGWSAYTRFARLRSAVFIPSKPVELKPGDRLRLTLHQDIVVDGSLAMFIRRSRYAISGSDGWPKWIDSAQFKSQREALAAANEKRNQIASINLPIAEENPEISCRHTYLFERGNWLNKGDEVQPGTPAIFPPLQKDAPHDRLAMARWLVSNDNPLTARVMVNRLWAELFGVGIVETLEDFGSSGQSPSHPELLDSLAVRFRDDMHWSVKQLLREIVLSATYRQDSKASPELHERDASNRLLARGPRERLTAEMVRDQALDVSGLLSRKMYGSPVMPPQPEGVWRSVYNGASWKTSAGEDRYRRALYTYWKRTSGYPSMMAFDTPSREVCTARRIVTNTPLQALATLNDEAQMEFAEALARRMEREGGPSIDEQAKWAYELATNQPPSPATVADLAELYREAVEAYKQQPTEMEKMADSAESAARALVANAILNLDAALTK
ncbi:MAG: PSD1 domain-containing protein [Pirellulales bacterium]|nr:PSD1 domain-containing protein [Pirellulales bacterium]